MRVQLIGPSTDSWWSREAVALCSFLWAHRGFDRNRRRPEEEERGEKNWKQTRCKARKSGEEQEAKEEREEREEEATRI